MMNVGDFRLRFGKHSGQTLRQIGMSNDGLKYLDWLVGWLEEDDARRLRFADLLEDLRGYLALPEVKRRVEEAIEDTWEYKPKDPYPKKWWEK